jgi:GNAT superfamily N-acetyltransferase
MSDQFHRDTQTLRGCAAPGEAILRLWDEADFPAIQSLSAAEGWSTPTKRPAESLVSWRASWPAIIAEDEDEVVGFLRALSDGAVTTYVAGLLVIPAWRGRGLGRALLDACQALAPTTRLDLLAEPEAIDFYTHTGFRPFAGFRRRRMM